jgi:hypothetical protein
VILADVNGKAGGLLCHAGSSIEQRQNKRGRRVMRGWGVMVLAVLPTAVVAAEPGVPPGVAQIAGCWRGEGAVEDKPVTMAIVARPAALGALLVVEADSQATADPADRYAAHLVFAGDGKPGTGVTGFWADSFGGGYTAEGRGKAGPDGFDITYAYPDGAFINEWRVLANRLQWRIIARGGKGSVSVFASYVLTRTACPAAP